MRVRGRNENKTIVGKHVEQHETDEYSACCCSEAEFFSHESVTYARNVSAEASVTLKPLTDCSVVVPIVVNRVIWLLQRKISFCAVKLVFMQHPTPPH